MRKIVSFVCLALSLGVLVCCSNPKEDTVSLDEISPTSSKYSKEKKDSTLVEERFDERPEKSQFLGVVDSIFPQSSWNLWDTTLFFDRFGAKKTEKWQLITSNDSLTLQYYSFTDSSRVKNAFFNWLDCFGPNCVSYQVGGNIRFQKRTGLVLVGEKEVLIFEGSKNLNKTEVLELLQPDEEKRTWLYVIELQKNKKALWTKMVKGKESKSTEL